MMNNFPAEKWHQKEKKKIPFNIMYLTSAIKVERIQRIQN